MNALNIYLQTCRYVMSADLNDRETWEEIYRYIPYLRESLSCYVCKNIAQSPMGRGYQVCQHFVCEKCVGGKMRLKPQCSWCKDYEDFHLLTDLQQVAYCFKRLCVYIRTTPLLNDIEAQAACEQDNDLKFILEEGCNYDDPVEECSPPLILPPTFSSLNIPPPVDICNFEEGHEKLSSPSVISDNEDSCSNDCPELSLTNPKAVIATSCDRGTTENADSPRARTDQKGPMVVNNFDDHSYGTISGPANSVSHPSIHTNKTRAKHRKISQNVTVLEKYPDSDTSAEIDILGMPTLTASINMQVQCVKNSSTREETLKEQNTNRNPSRSKYLGQLPSKRSKPNIKLKVAPQGSKLCKCGRGGTNSRLTCLGQRCPCYINKLPCIGCKCQGCRNPRKKYDDNNDLTITRVKQEVKDFSDKNKFSEQYDYKGV